MQKKKYRGVLVANAFLRTKKFTEHYGWLKAAAEKCGMDLAFLSNSDLLFPLCSKKISAGVELKQRVEAVALENDFVIYWDKDIPLGNMLQFFCREQNVPVFNSLDSIAVCDNKYETYQKLWEWNQSCARGEEIPILPTIAAPMTYPNVGYPDTSFLAPVLSALGLPVVIKECYGSFGQQVYLAGTKEEAGKITKKLAGKPFLYQWYQKESSGRDVRLQVVGDKVVAAMYRFSESDFRANISNGGQMEQYFPTEEECSLAVRTARVLGLDFAGVDLLFTGERADVVCEVNSNAHFKNSYLCTGVNTAEFIMEHIKCKLIGEVLNTL